MTKGIAIGIDLGTTYSCVGVWRNNHVEIIANDQGNRTTPSYVSFDKNERLVGDPAYFKSGSNPKNTIFGIKRLMGRRFHDETVQSDMKYWPFKVIEKNERPCVQVEYKNETKFYIPEEISSMILKKMKTIAEDYIGQTVTDVVITVPAYFNDAQRKATVDAGKIAGLNVLRIVNEPTAAALAYGIHNEIENKDNILVVDLGGGTYDVSLLSINDGKFKVKAIAGDTHLGGEDFNNRMVDYFKEEIKQKYKKDISNNLKAVSRLRKACERAKRVLSSSTYATIEINYLLDGDDFYSDITRARFEEINSDIFDKIIEVIKTILEDSKLSKSDISDIVLVGGSTRIPKIQDMISTYFNGKKLMKMINPDEAVAYGAAVQASLLNGETSEKIEKIKLSDVIPLSLGVRVRENDMSTFITRNSTYPIKEIRTHHTRHDYQTKVLFEIFEGERPVASKNHLLDSITLKGITPAPRGKTKFEIIFDIDDNGTLTVSAREKGTGLYKKITVENNTGKLYRSEIERMIMEAEKYKEEDEKEKERLKSLNDLEDYAYNLRKSINNRKLSSNYINITMAINNTLEWIKNNKNASIEDYNNKKLELQLKSMRI